MNHLIIYKWHWYYLKLIFKFIAKQETRVYIPKVSSTQPTSEEAKRTENIIGQFLYFTVIQSLMEISRWRQFWWGIWLLSDSAAGTDTMRFIINTVAILEFSFNQNTITAAQTWWGLENEMFNLSAKQRCDNDADVP